MSSELGPNPVLDRVRAAGPASASPVDLVAVGLSRRASDVAEQPARELLLRIGRIQNILAITPQEIRDACGLDDYETLRVQALLELGRRAAGSGKGLLLEIDGPEDVAEMYEHLMNEKREHFCAVLLDVKNRVIKAATIHIGTLDSSLVGPREVFREAIREGAASIIVVHNHPSGDPTPSPEDLEVTERLVSIGKLMDIPVLDHVILGERTFKSLRRMGLMP